MSDLRARIADALREELRGLAIVPKRLADHLADVLLALPGIAVVELPTHNLWPLDECSFGNNPVPMTPELARAIAAGLLAAADAVERKTT